MGGCPGLRASLDSLISCGRGPVIMALGALGQAYHPTPNLHTVRTLHRLEEKYGACHP